MSAPLRELFGPPGPVELSWVDRGGVAQVVDGETLGPVTLSGGRAQPGENVDAATLKFTVEAAGPFDKATRPRPGDQLGLALTPAALDVFGISTTTPPVWLVDELRVTDVQLRVVIYRGRPVSVLDYIATGRKAQLGRYIVGATPWPAQSVRDRLLAISAAVEAAGGPALDVALVDDDPRLVIARDVDAQNAQELLDGLSSAVGGLLVERRDGRLGYQTRDHRNARVSVDQLDARQIITATSWAQGLDGLANDWRVAYGPELIDPETGEGSGEWAQVVDSDPVSVERHGRRQAELQTPLADQGDAADLAQLLVARHGRPSWRIDALALDVLHTLAPAVAGRLVLAEVGDLIELTGMPASTPTLPWVFVEGWEHTITRQGWQLVLRVSDADQTAAAPTWADVPDELTWADLDPELTWQQAAAWFAPPTATDRWLDAPADLTWADVDPMTTWASWRTPAA